jgi:hypothetical protein
MPYTEDKACETADEFLEYFSRHRWLRTRDEYSAFYVGLNGFIFRGQSNAEWKLTPSAFRDNTLREYTPQTAWALRPDGKDLRAWLGMHLHAELRAVFLFLETADRLGIPTPIDYTNINEHLELITAALKQQESQSYDFPFPSAPTLNQLALAQHHGVPTRLLDWTESPYIAAYFGAYGTSQLADETMRIRTERFAVLMLRTHDIRKYPDSLMLVNAPRHTNSFLRVQKGLFTHIPKANRYLLDHKKWPSTEDIVEETPGLQGSLIRVSLPTLEAPKLLRRLYDMDITRHSLMPSLDNAARACSYTLNLFRRPP